MLAILSSLEPRQEERGTILLDELDEFQEVLFVMKGQIFIGYECNKIKKYCIKLSYGCNVGAFGITLNQRSSYIYLCATKIEGHAIRKENWIKIMNDYQEVSKTLKKNIILHQFLKVHSKVELSKKRTLEKLMHRNDYSTIFSNQPKPGKTQMSILNQIEES